MKVRDLFAGVWTGTPLKLRDMYDKRELDSAINGKVSAQTVVLKDTRTGQIFGKRTIYQK